MPRPIICVVKSCKNEKSDQDRSGTDITFHRFPDNLDLRQKWLDCLGQNIRISKKSKEKQICKNALICSDHFTPESFMKGSNKSLRYLAIPTLNAKDEDEVSKKCFIEEEDAQQHKIFLNEAPFNDQFAIEDAIEKFEIINRKQDEFQNCQQESLSTSPMQFEDEFRTKPKTNSDRFIPLPSTPICEFVTIIRDGKLTGDQVNSINNEILEQYNNRELTILEQNEMITDLSFRIVKIPDNRTRLDCLFEIDQIISKYEKSLEQLEPMQTFINIKNVIESCNTNSNITKSKNNESKNKVSKNKVSNIIPSRQQKQQRVIEERIHKKKDSAVSESDEHNRPNDPNVKCIGFKSCPDGQKKFIYVNTSSFSRNGSHDNKSSKIVSEKIAEKSTTIRKTTLIESDEPTYTTDRDNNIDSESGSKKCIGFMNLDDGKKKYVFVEQNKLFITEKLVGNTITKLSQNQNSQNIDNDVVISTEKTSTMQKYKNPILEKSSAKLPVMNSVKKIMINKNKLKPITTKALSKSGEIKFLRGLNKKRLKNAGSNISDDVDAIQYENDAISLSDGSSDNETDSAMINATESQLDAPLPIDINVEVSNEQMDTSLPIEVSYDSDYMGLDDS